ncbi:MAG: sulfite exporter TauE/SafE family protein [Ignavibacteria bacterium]|nr:sulfite exporter TauE/SafE family protein [Ignavibacteria bacterium]
MYEIVILVIIGLITGAVSGMLGIGGGMIVIPSLVVLLNFSQKMAQGTSLAMLLPPIGLLAAYNYYKAGYVDVKAAIILIITFVIGSYFTSKIVVTLPDQLVKKIFAAFLVVYAIKIFLE